MIRRTDSRGDVIHFFKIKDLHYFKLLLSDFDLSIVREFLHIHIEVVQIMPNSPYLLQAEYRYVPNQNITVSKKDSNQVVQLKQGYVIDEIKEEILATKLLVLYRLSIRAELILKKLYYLDLPIVAQLKNSEKLAFYEKCLIVNLNFGTYVYRKGDPVDAIYVVLQGQIKILRKKKEQIFQIATVQKGKMFGLYCLKNGRTSRELIARSGQNETQILVIGKNILEEVFNKKQKDLDRIIQSVKSQISSRMMQKSVEIRQNDLEGEKRSEMTLESRVKGFQKERNIMNKFIEDLAQTKTLLLRVRDLNTSVRKRSTQCKMLTKTSQQIARKDKWRYQKMATRYTEIVSTQREQGRKSLMRSFVGLTRFPSVKKYLSQLSKQQ